MTTIACDGKMIAGDGRLSGNGLIHSDKSRKVYRLNCGAVVGFSGNIYTHGDALDFLNGESEEISLGEQFEAIILYADGRCECMDGDGRRYEQSTPCVTGSGGGLALAAMAAGKSPIEAVKIAAQFDMMTGGDVMHLVPFANVNEAA